MNDDTAACSDVKLADQGRVSKGETLKSETLEFYLLTDLNLDILELEVNMTYIMYNCTYRSLLFRRGVDE